MKKYNNIVLFFILIYLNAMHLWSNVLFSCPLPNLLRYTIMFDSSCMQNNMIQVACKTTWINWWNYFILTGWHWPKTSHKGFTDFIILRYQGMLNCVPSPVIVTQENDKKMASTRFVDSYMLIPLLLQKLPSVTQSMIT